MTRPDEPAPGQETRPGEETRPDQGRADPARTGVEEFVDPLSLVAAARSQRKSFGRLSRLVARSVPVVWDAGRGVLVATLVLQVAVAAALACQVIVVQAVLDAILELDANGSPTALLLPVLALAGLTSFSAAAASVLGHLQRYLGERVARAVVGRVLDVATGVSLRHFESADFYNRLNRVQTNALTRPYQVSQGLITAAGALAASVGVGLALVAINVWLLPLVVLGGVPVLLASRRESRREFEFAVRQTENQRLRMYLAAVQTGRDEAKEVRAFATGTWLRSRFERLFEAYLADLAVHLRRRSLLGLAGHVGSAVVLVATFALLVRLIVEGQVTVAGAGAAIVAIRLLANQVQVLFRGVQSIFESGLFLDDLDAFLDLGARARGEDVGHEAPTDVRLVEARDVTFTYPDGGAPAVVGASIELRAGEVVALVGENGSGKTTLAKILTGLYEPDHGAVRWNGSDLRTLRRSSVQARIAVVFQDFVRYALSAEDNIALGPVDGEAARAGVRSAAATAGIDATLRRLPQGYRTILSRMFAGGHDLSGGQWQRVALARAFYRDAPVVILDEPSASLDPRAESELFAHLRDLLRGRTALFISHRFSTVRGADRIYVLAEGAVVEHGTHEELLARRGQYAELYRLQADAYVVREGGTVASEPSPGVNHGSNPGPRPGANPEPHEPR